MSNIIDQLNQEQIAGKTIPDFGPGDTVVHAVQRSGRVGDAFVDHGCGTVRPE